MISGAKDELNCHGDVNMWLENFVASPGLWWKGRIAAMNPEAFIMVTPDRDSPEAEVREASTNQTRSVTQGATSKSAPRNSSTERATAITAVLEKILTQTEHSHGDYPHGGINE